LFPPSLSLHAKKKRPYINQDTRLTQTVAYKFWRATICVVGWKVALLTASRIQQALSQEGRTGNHKIRCYQRAILRSNFASGNRQRKMAPSPFLFNKPILQSVSLARYSSTTLRNPLCKFIWDLSATYNATRTNHTLVTCMCRWGHFSSLVTSQHSRLERKT